MKKREKMGNNLLGLFMSRQTSSMTQTFEAKLDENSVERSFGHLPSTYSAVFDEFNDSFKATVSESAKKY